VPRSSGLLVGVDHSKVSKSDPANVTIYKLYRIIKSIQVVNTYPRKLLGLPPCTLTDYFNK
jgi:hypothetical protein